MSCVKNFPASESVSESSGGTPWHFDDNETSVSGSSVEVLTFTVPAGRTRFITAIIGVACCEGVFELKNGADIIAKFTTTPSNFTETFKFDPPLPIIAGSTVVLNYTANVDNPNVDVHGFIMGNDKLS